MIAIHVIEHFYRWEVPDILKEWRRVLKPGGRLILELPDMQKVIQYIISAAQHGQPIWAQMTWWALWGDPRHENPLMAHRWGYTSEILSELLRTCGYNAIRVEAPRYHLKKRDMRIVAYQGGV